MSDENLEMKLVDIRNRLRQPVSDGGNGHDLRPLVGGVVGVVATLACVGALYVRDIVFNSSEPPSAYTPTFPLETVVIETLTPPPTYTLVPTPTYTPIPADTPTQINTPTPTYTPIPADTPTQINTPTPIPVQINTPTPTPELITQVIPVWSTEEDGVRVDISDLGVYKIAYLNDAYSPWPNEQYPGYQGWTNILRIYVNRPVEWGITDYGLEGPINYDAYLGPGGYHFNKEDAITASKGDRQTFRLNAGDYLTLVTLDERGQYADNRGKIDVGVTHLRQ